MSNLIYTPTGLIVDEVDLFSGGDVIDWLLDTMTFGLGKESDNSSIQKAQIVNQLAVDCVDNDFTTIDAYFDAVAEYVEIDPYVLFPLTR
jgi:hypothetical protein